MVRRTVTGNACVSVTREKRVATGSAPVPWSTLGGPHFPPSPLPLPVEERKEERGGWLERKNNPSRNGRTGRVRAR